MYKNEISAVYQIVNTITGDRYVGSSKNVKGRWSVHKCPSVWKIYSNRPLYQDMQKYGVDKFRFQILAPVEPEHLKQVEQEFIEMLKPAYNSMNAKGWDVERIKETNRKYRQSDKAKKSARKYRQTDKGKEMNRKQARKDMKKYNHQLCLYKGEEVILVTLASRFHKAGIEHPTLEAKKYLLAQQ